jgi:hypothetical protein
MPAIEEKNEITKATNGGSKIDVSTPETGKRMRKKSIFLDKDLRYRYKYLQKTVVFSEVLITLALA